MSKSNLNKKSINFSLINEIQPMGGISFADESVIKTGNGYETCLNIGKYPVDLDDFWLTNITNFDGTVVTLDISNDDVNVVKKNINRSMKEQNTRYSTSNDYISQSDAENKFIDMKNLMDEINILDEVVKNMTARIFITDRSWLSLDETTKNIIEVLEGKGYSAFTSLNETKSDWTSLFTPYTEQQYNKFSIRGQTLTSNAIAGGNPFHFSSLEDKYGTFWGTTPTGGNVFLDFFEKSNTRKFYNAIAFGTMGAGKSTLLKKAFEDRAIRGDFVRAFDISGEFTRITNTYGGRVINLDGTDDSALNPLEILRSGDDDSVNFARHIAKLNTIYRFLNPEATQEEVTIFSNCMHEFYECLNLVPSQDTYITGRPAKEYPIFSDFHEYLVEKMKVISMDDYNDAEIATAQHQIELLTKIDNTIIFITSIYGALFDRHTSMDNILDEQIVTFNISKLKDMDSNVFDAQIFSMVSLSFDNCVKNGSFMYELYQNGQIEFEDIVRFLIIIDESHRWINTNKLQALDLVTKYAREARKYFGGILFASQSIRDYVPEGSNSDSINKLKTLFELTQYKFIFQHDSNAVPLIENVFSNELTLSQLSRIPRLETGSCILSIASDVSLEFNVFITDEEEEIFSGGV